jgi:zinc protease
LPTNNRKETWKDVSPRFPEKITKVEFKKGIDEKGMIGMAMKTKFEWTDENKIELYALNQVLNIKLRESIREDEGGTYGINVQMAPEKFPLQEVTTLIIFGCDPKKQDKYVKIILAEMDKLIKNGPTEDDLNKVKETMIRERETNLKKNDWWKSKIENLYYYNDPFDSVDKFNDQINALTIDKIKSASTKYLTPNHYVQVFLKPEGKK